MSTTTGRAKRRAFLLRQREIAFNAINAGIRRVALDGLHFCHDFKRSGWSRYSLDPRQHDMERR